MAIIKKFTKLNYENIKLHRQTEVCSEIQIDKGKGCIKIETFGSSRRENKGAVSQNMTFSQEALVQLKSCIDSILK